MTIEKWTDDLEVIISDTHDIDVRDSDYAVACAKYMKSEIDAAVKAETERCATICDTRKLSPNKFWTDREREGYETAVVDMQMATADAIRAPLIREGDGE